MAVPAAARRRCRRHCRRRAFLGAALVATTVLTTSLKPPHQSSYAYPPEQSPPGPTPTPTALALQWPDEPKPEHEIPPPGSHPYRTIPRHIWQTSRSLPLGPRAHETVATWTEQNPDWSHHLATDADVDAFFRTRFPRNVYDAFSKLPLGVMKADMWRLAVVYYYGGVYADIDTRCVRPVDAWLGPEQDDGCTAIIAMESFGSFTNAAFAAVPRHPVFKRALDGVVEKIERDGGVKPEGIDFVADYTGPPTLTKAVRVLIRSEHEDASGIINDGGERARAKAMGICLKENKYFNGLNVGHDFASVSWNMTHSWRKERYKVFGGKAVPKEKGAGRFKRVHIVGGGKVEIANSGGKVLKPPT